MAGCPQHTKPILFLWRFNEDGIPYMDSRIDIKSMPEKEAVHAAQMMELRQRFNSDSYMSLLHVDLDTTIESVEAYIDSAKLHPALREEVVSKLKAAKVRVGDLLGKGHDSMAVNYILALEQDVCTCAKCREEE